MNKLFFLQEKHFRQKGLHMKGFALVACLVLLTLLTSIIVYQINFTNLGIFGRQASMANKKIRGKISAKKLLSLRLMDEMGDYDIYMNNWQLNRWDPALNPDARRDGCTTLYPGNCLTYQIDGVTIKTFYKLGSLFKSPQMAPAGSVLGGHSVLRTILEIHALVEGQLISDYQEMIIDEAPATEFDYYFSNGGTIRLSEEAVTSPNNVSGDMLSVGELRIDGSKSTYTNPSPSHVFRGKLIAGPYMNDLLLLGTYGGNGNYRCNGAVVLKTQPSAVATPTTIVTTDCSALGYFPDNTTTKGIVYNGASVFSPGIQPEDNELSRNVDLVLYIVLDRTTNRPRDIRLGPVWTAGTNPIPLSGSSSDLFLKTDPACVGIIGSDVTANDRSITEFYNNMNQSNVVTGFSDGYSSSDPPPFDGCRLMGNAVLGGTADYGSPPFTNRAVGFGCSYNHQIQRWRRTVDVDMKAYMKCAYNFLTTTACTNAGFTNCGSSVIDDGLVLGMSYVYEVGTGSTYGTMIGSSATPYGFRIKNATGFGDSLGLSAASLVSFPSVTIDALSLTTELQGGFTISTDPSIATQVASRTRDAIVAPSFHYNSPNYDDRYSGSTDMSQRVACNNYQTPTAPVDPQDWVKCSLDIGSPVPCPSRPSCPHTAGSRPVVRANLQIGYPMFANPALQNGPTGTGPYGPDRNQGSITLAIGCGEDFQGDNVDNGFDGVVTYGLYNNVSDRLSNLYGGTLYPDIYGGNLIYEKCFKPVLPHPSRAGKPAYPWSGSMPLSEQPPYQHRPRIIYSVPRYGN